MINLNKFIFLITLNLLLFSSILFRSQLISKRNFYVSIGTFFLIVSLLYSSSTSLVLLVFFVFYFIIALSVYIQFKNIIFTIFIIGILNTSMLFSWLITCDLLDILLVKNIITHAFHNSFMPFMELFQQVIFASICLLLKKIGGKFKISDVILYPLKKNYYIIFFFFILLVFQIIGMIFVEEGINNAYDKLFIFFSLTVFIFALIIFYSAISLNYTYRKESQLKVLRENYLYEKKNFEDSREFRHDLNSLLVSLKYTLEKERNIDSAVKLLSEISSFFEKINRTNLFSQIERINNIPVQGLLIEFIKKCNKKDVKMIIQVRNETTLDSLELLDILKALSILLDNALEASIKEDNPEIALLFSRENGTDLIEITNTFSKSETSFYTDLLTKKGFSTKGKNRGLGLHSLEKIFQRYSNCDYTIKKDRTKFRVTLYLKQ